jgi:hypothetical protein
MNFDQSFEARRYKAGLVVSLVLASSVAAAFCPPQYVNEWVAPQFANATQVLNQAMNAVDSALSAQLEMQNQRLTSAIAVLTKQKAVAANQIADAGRTAAQQTATALNVLAQSERVKAARFDFGGEFGQGYSPCKVYAARSVIAGRDSEMQEERRVRVNSEILAAPGRYADPDQARRSLVQAHQDFCTQDQVDSGLCKTKGALPGADLTVSTLFEPAMEGEKLYNAKVAFVNNAVGMPDGVIPTGAAGAPSAEAYTQAKSRKDALVSPALTSLKEIQLDYSGVNSAHGGQDLPLAVHFRNEVKRYAGNSPEYAAWARVMSAQNERGLLVEMLKVKALDLAVLEKQYRQYERMEASLATLVAMEAGDSGVATRVNAAAQQAVRQNVTQKIK